MDRLITVFLAAAVVALTLAVAPVRPGAAGATAQAGRGAAPGVAASSTSTAWYTDPPPGAGRRWS